ncbi:membrane protein of unknown function [Pseudorhizobium banfieldiae]|uniref:Uncharacterized protein n=1 Tax=Pseudorhizobium banfieldiae TaxID=1125847 RepID=L0NGI1_9HYPH|nr:hypothetical protein [Pseudorhizobium banfieldiae]CAD6615085.1 hypothetical protein RNT25_02776 [arsenite-oxidising bacterium NT-25]CCF20160.1 membrane protein of unknown function [Pseudorhizobium banfieldiae]
MSDDALRKESKGKVQWYADDIPIRGCQLSLSVVKAAYRELTALTQKEGEAIISKLARPEEVSEEDFAKRNTFLLDDAFRVTVSIIGFDGETTYGEDETIFESTHLPQPIKTILFTNVTAFKRHSDGAEPRNRFYVWLHFDKPPLFDPNPLVSEPTANSSLVEIKADDVGYFRAVQTIVTSKLCSKRRFHSFIHEKFAYDIGLWFVAIPYALYWVTVYNDYFFPANGPLASYRVAFFIYASGMCLILYRALFMYLKWAFPVNVLEENKDNATTHRVVLGGIFMGLIISGITSVVGTLAGP